MVIIDRWSLHRNTANNDQINNTGFLKSPTSTKFVKAAINLTKLVEVGKHFAKFVKFANNFKKFVEFAKNFMKFIELTSNFTKFVGLVINFYEVHRSWEKFLQSLWDSPITFGKSVSPTKTL